MDATQRILIVDDEPNVRLMLLTALESVGYEVVEAADGEAALERLRDSNAGPAFDLILLDLLMPKMDGMELLRRLRAQDCLVPVVILTAHGSIPEAVEAMKLGAIDFLAKPLTPDALRCVVAEVIDRDSGPPSVPLVPRKESKPRPLDHSKQIAFDLARAKRAINRGQFSEAEELLRDLVALDPSSAEGHALLDRLLTLKKQEERGSFRILRDWFPSGTTREKRR
jgi:DNA-binding NtrC family response regulator